MDSTPNLRGCIMYEPVVGYDPGSMVIDQCAIDRDQASIESALALDDFERARVIINNGGHSKSYAVIELDTEIQNDIEKGKGQFIGLNADGNTILGKNLEDCYFKDKKVLVEYLPMPLQETQVECHVGGLGELAEKRGCFVEAGNISIDGISYTYQYNIDNDTKNAITIAHLSDKAANLKTFGCYAQYFGTDNFTNEFVQAAIDEEKTSFSLGNTDFSKFRNQEKKQVIKKGTAYMNVLMKAIVELEHAVEICQADCKNCNDQSIHEWDAGVCFTAGGMQGPDGDQQGKLLFELGNIRGKDFKTCGVNGDTSSGMAKLNYELVDLFALGKSQLARSNCSGARKTVDKVVSKMIIPLIQSTIKFAYKVQNNGTANDKAKCTIFALTVLPLIHAVDPEAAHIIYENTTNEGATSMNAVAVKKAFEKAYPSLGISCADVGGLLDDKEYFHHMEPCQDTLAAVPFEDGGSGATTTAP